MKAKFFLLGLCALGLMACSIDEVSQVNDSNAIQFKATASTRAEATTTNNINEFTVWAWNGDNLFMEAVTATKSGSVFTTSPLYFWPTGSVDFYALTEVAGHGIFTDASSQQHEYALLGGSIDESGDGWTYTGNVAKAQVDNGSIVIDACIPSTPEEQIDICYGVALEKSSGSVPMNFRHALSQVAFKAKNVNTAFDVKIADVSVCSVYSEGVYTIGKNDTSENLKTSDIGTSEIAGSQGSWAITETGEGDVAIKSRYLVNLESSIVQLDTLGTVEDLVDPYGTLMLLPQEVVGWVPLTDANDDDLGGYIRILCHVEEHGSQLWPNTNEENAYAEQSDDTDSAFKTIDDVEYAEIAIPLEDIEWEQGYRYTYTIIFGEGLGYYPPDDPNYDLDGTPVLVPITFKVTVDEFQDAEATTEGQFDIETEVDLSEIEVKSAAELAGALRMGYEVIDVTASIEVTEALEVYQDCVLNLGEEVVITYADSCVDHQNGSSIIMVYGGTLTINAEDGAGLATTGSSEAGDCSCIWLNGGNVIINDGSFYGASWDDNSTYQYASATIYAQNGFAYIYGGEFYGGYADLWKEDSILNCLDSSRRSGDAWIYVYGGDYYNFDPANNGSEGNPTNYCADGYSTVYDEETDCYTVILTTVATPADLTAAIEAGASEITVTESIALTTEYPHLDFSSDCTLTLEDGVVLTPHISENGDGTAFGTDGTSTTVIRVNGGTLTINAGEGAGIATDGTAASVDVSCIWLYDGDVVINGGTYYGGSWDDSEKIGSSATVYVEYGFAYINGGTFYGGRSTAYKSEGWKVSDNDYVQNGQTEVIINILDAARNTTPKQGWVYVTGGNFRNYDPENNATEGANTNFCAENYASPEPTVDADGNYWFTVTESGN